MISASIAANPIYPILAKNPFVLYFIISLKSANAIITIIAISTMCKCVFVMSDNGKMGAVTGAHDDMVSALWLAIQGLKSPYWYI